MFIINSLLLLFFFIQVGLKDGLQMTINYFRKELKKSQKNV